MGLALAARLILAAVFTVAASTKLADRSGSIVAMEGFGVPPALAPAGSWLLPLAEFVAAIGLLVPVASWSAAVAATVLLAAFTVVISISLARGRRVDCHCFGQLRASLTGRSTIFRNVALLAVAVVVVVGGPGATQLSPVGWVDRLTAVELVLTSVTAGLALIVVAQAWFLFELFRQNGDLLNRLDHLESNHGPPGDGLPAARGRADASGWGRRLDTGAHAPDFELPSIAGGTVSLLALLARGLPIMLVFVDPQCKPCASLLPEVSRWQRKHAGRLTIALLSRGGVAANRSAIDHGIRDVLLQDDRATADAYGAAGTPSALVVSTDGRIASELAVGAEAISDLLSSSLALTAATSYRGTEGQSTLPHHPTALRVGQPVPDLRWADLDGREVRIADLQGTSIGMIFWNPRCGFCERTLPDLLRIMPAARKSGTRMLVVSTGEKLENVRLGLPCTVVLEDGFRTAQVFGAAGTPSAVLVDRAGRLASGPAVGGPAVLSLLTQSWRGGELT